MKRNIFLEFEQTSSGKDTDRRPGRRQYGRAVRLLASRNRNGSQSSEGTQRVERKPGEMVRLVLAPGSLLDSVQTCMHLGLVTR